MGGNYWLFVALWGILVVHGECFVIPKAHFEVLHPHGLRVSIPDVAGIRLFGFHGALNEAIRVNQQGTINGVVNEAKDSRWTFTDPRVIIKGDDVINYWIYVQFNNLGYHMEGTQLVTDASNGSIYSESTSTASPECVCSPSVHNHYHYHYYNFPEGSNPSGNDSQESSKDAAFEEKLSNLEHELNRTRDVASYVDAQVSPLERELRTLQEMVNYLINSKKRSQISRELLLLGHFPSDIPFPMDFLEALLREKLSIDDISAKIRNVRYPSEGEIVFEVSSVADKVLLLQKAKETKLIEAGYILMNNPSDP
ncbi:uncharacterized protein LOC129790345 [Lutzomyia longipalpis]|uniref:uncharacterized protein LOC129790345 n=1 Tax=Lutzomyia longipalpis TaxID=7200 RepID=UPI0024845DAB|nr:uncharacterized protein LOC129790345 [Lutzomyia longipalpis]